ncbi:MAG TPA: hypothetical protein VFX21_14420 [Acidimicrobiia bacterium]|nr:hypothetical protein [Acidimicrobiia bacterium]
MRVRILIPVVVLSLTALGACGGSDKPKAESESTSTAPSPGGTAHVAKAATDDPSVSAKMVCSDEAQEDIYKGATGVKPTKVTTPTWEDHVYACDFVYPNGTMRLETKELADADATKKFFDEQAEKLGKKEPLTGIGEEGFSTDDGGAVIRKDYKVLTVDVSKLPAQFGLPLSPRSDVAINTAFTIFQCWVGA